MTTQGKSDAEKMEEQAKLIELLLINKADEPYDKHYKKIQKAFLKEQKRFNKQRKHLESLYPDTPWIVMKDGKVLFKGHTENEAIEWRRQNCGDEEIVLIDSTIDYPPPMVG